MGLCMSETNLARMGLCVSKVLVYRILARMGLCMSKSILARMGLSMSEVLVYHILARMGLGMGEYWCSVFAQEWVCV